MKRLPLHFVLQWAWLLALLQENGLADIGIPNKTSLIIDLALNAFES